MTQQNGAAVVPAPNSAFVDHLLKYPVIQAGVTRFQQNQYGQKTIMLGDSAYKHIAGPVMPYLSKPYQYVSPYIQKADHLGDQTLSKVDERFPVVKKGADEIYTDAKSIILLPYQKSMEGKDHVVGIYSAEYKKVGGDGMVTYGKALVSTFFLLGSETITWMGEVLVSKKDDAKETANDLKEKADN